jgi:hypothetical protein
MAKKKQQKSPYPFSVETFGDVHPNMFYTHNEPSAFNGIVRIRKKRITVEEVDEPIEVLCERLQKLWENTDNHHLYQPILTEAEKLGYKLKGEFGRWKKNAK